MALASLQINDLRVIEEAHLELSPRLNFIFGANGAGKTSILEAVHLLGRAKSFRSTSTELLIRNAAANLGVYGRLYQGTGLDCLSVGIEKNKKETRIKLAGKAVNSLSELAPWFPLQLIGADSFKLICDGSRERRSFVDWGIFQYSPERVGSWHRYNTALKQRNAALKNRMSDSVCVVWDDEIATHGENIDAYREDYLQHFRPAFLETWQLFNNGLPIPDFSYKRGWSKDSSLREALQRSLIRDRDYGFTRIGPQRAELDIYFDGKPADEVLSRGQSKILATSMLVAQVMLLRNVVQRSPVMVMVDDLTAELDELNSSLTMQLLLECEAQLFVTSIGRDVRYFDKNMNNDVRWFHVEHGSVKLVE